ncbi:MAG: hypothetical protein WCW47_00465 [Candidatus Paceibacterota bacterium]|jgi:hypothetical protein
MNLTNNKGFIGRIILLIIAVIALKYFLHFDLLEWLRSPKAQEIIQPAITFFKILYNWLDDVIRNLIVNKAPTF